MKYCSLSNIFKCYCLQMFQMSLPLSIGLNKQDCFNWTHVSPAYRSIFKSRKDKQNTDDREKWSHYGGATKKKRSSVFYLGGKWMSYSNILSLYCCGSASYLFSWKRNLLIDLTGDFNLFLHTDALRRLCSRRLSKTLWQKEILLKTSNFSFVLIF